jgi:hypothetical protein
MRRYSVWKAKIALIEHFCGKTSPSFNARPPAPPKLEALQAMLPQVFFRNPPAAPSRLPKPRYQPQASDQKPQGPQPHPYWQISN